ncbi:MAG: hypothetical protein HRU38_09580 [Saccharospirillaceae bacterium]|nr:hypothetical protein [Pseudomonadales bacterium]NRB78902.1 hypothetical protein [Saccharospirillaceae bacterium]
MKKLLLVITSLILLNACQSTSTSKTSLVKPATHQATGILAPATINDLTRVKMTDYAAVTKSSSISYKNVTSIISTYFRANDITDVKYFDSSKQVINAFYKVDAAVFEDEITYELNGQPYKANVFRGYDSTMLKSGDPLSLAKIYSVIVFNYGDYIIKVRHDNFGFVGAQYNNESANFKFKAEQLFLNELLKTLVL